MKQILIIKGDTNDADYITRETELEGWAKEQLPIIRKVAEAIKNSDGPHNWGVSEYCDSCERPEYHYEDILTEDDIEIFDEFIPWGQHGIHSIESIRILTIANEEQLI
jgi:hypothetical protein